MRSLAVAATKHDFLANFERGKYDPDFPTNAVAYCLSEAGLKKGALDYVVFYDKPFLKPERLLETYLAFAPAGFQSFSMAIPVWT